MSAVINTYTGLQAAVATWLARDGDTDITSRFDDLLALCEQRMWWGKPAMPSLGLPAHEPIRISAMENINTSFTMGDPVGRPLDFLEMISATQNSPYQPIDIVEQSILDNYGGQANDSPMMALDGVNFRWVGPAASTSATIRYYAKLATPTSSTVNWILTNAPGVYLNGCLLEAAILTQDLEAAKVYAAMYAADAGGLNEARNRQAWSARNMRVRLRGRTP